MLRLDALRECKNVSAVLRVRICEYAILVTIFGLLFSTVSYGQSEETVDFNIPSLALPQALNAFARQARVELVFAERGFDNVQTTAVVGSFQRERALELLLAGTGLRVGYGSGDSLIVQRASNATVGAVGSMDSEIFPHLLAQANVGPDRQMDDAGTSQSQQNNASADSDVGQHSGTPIDEVIVTGTHIRGVDSVGASSITFTREELDNAGFSTLGDVFESLPQNFDEINIDGTSADGVSVVAASNGQLASGISLRGLGPGSTLVLLNGKRRPGSVRGRVVDVSAIPLSMVERVEVVTGGRSAVYGSDAVAGVVNIITRTSFDGAETQVYYGEASAGGEQFNFGLTFGREFDNGGFVVGYDYRKEQLLDATDTGLVQGPSSIGITPIPGLYGLRAPSEQHVGTFAGHYELSGKVELYADAQFSADENEGGQLYLFEIPGCCAFDGGGIFVTDSDQYSAAGGVRFDAGKDWQIDISGLHGAVDNIVLTASPFVDAGTFTSFNIEPEMRHDEKTELTSFSAIADGPLGQFQGNPVSAAIGIDFRDESFKRTQSDLLAGTAELRENLDRDVWSVFGEVHLPLLVNRNEQRLEVSLAARYDDYSDFGSTFNPQIGIEWEPIRGLTFRGSYSEAFRAPDLFSLGFSNVGRVRIIDDPLDPTGMTTAALFTETGGNLALQPEEADTYTIGIDWQPSDRSKLSISYFNIKYDGRIDEPSPTDTTALQDEALLVGLINRNPTPEQLDVILNRITGFRNSSGVPFDPTIDDPFATFSNIVLFDNRQNNIGLEEIDGLDFQALTVLETNSGDWSFGLNGTYTMDFTRNITVTSPGIDQLNRPGKPVDLRFRGHIGWSRSAWNVNADVNYVDSYEDTFAATPTKIDSWTTVDLTLRFVGSEVTDNGFLNGVMATLGISNAFDEDPPIFLNNFAGLGFDGVNSNPVGRFVSLRLSKRW